eukprot:g2216.t1
MKSRGRRAAILIVFATLAISTVAVDEFVPTEEFQDVQEGQALPGGLHYRIDLSTGRKQAKLIASEKKEENGLIQLPPDSIEQSTPSSPIAPGKFNAELAKKVLLGLPNPDPSLLNAMKSDSKMTREEIEKLVKKVWEKRQIEIEKAANEIEVPADKMMSLLRDLDNSTSTGEMLRILDDLEWLIGDLDNAQDFRKMGGLVPIVRLLNMTSSPKVQSKAAWVLGTASKDIVMTQNEATELGALSDLLNMIEPSKNDVRVQGKALYALGSLLRHNPSTQMVFQRLQGVSSLAQTMNTCVTSTEMTIGTLKVMRKITSLIGDLLREESNRQEEDFVAKNWMRLFVDAIETTLPHGHNNLSLRGDVIETHEKIFEAMLVLFPSTQQQQHGLLLADLCKATTKLYESWGSEYEERTEITREVIERVMSELVGSQQHEGL